MELSQLDLSALSLTPGKHASYNGVPFEFLLSNADFFRAPFGASHFNNPAASRLSLEFVVSDAVLAKLQELDQKILALAIAHRIFPDKTPEEVTKSYHSLLVAAPKYDQVRFRTKIVTHGFGATRFWKHPERTLLNPEDDLKNVLLRPHCAVQGVWNENGKWGVSVLCRNILVQHPEETPCPF